jgi:cation diffusion facilitator CzcD-associated flavoprotein CzcO/acetyl esterase/lipase
MEDELIDVVIVGAGFAGLYALQRCRTAGFSAVVLESADDVGGTWYWNRYPGARCDIVTDDYTYSWDPQLEDAWTWSEKYATQPEILRYLQFVAERYDLRKDIRFSTTVKAAAWDGERQRWRITSDDGDTIAARYYVMATGCLSMPKMHDIEGTDRFRGDVYYTARWPHEGVDFSAKRVAVIGTGSSGIQSIPLIAEQAADLTVFQRTPNFSVPAQNGAIAPERHARLLADRVAYREAAKWSRGGVPVDPPALGAWQMTDEERRARFEQAWNEGELFSILGLWADQGVNLKANEMAAELIRERIRSTVHDPAIAAKLSPTDHPFGTKRPCLDTNYYATFNRPNVHLVDLHEHPITTITETGIETADRSFEFDAIVFATGFDAMTGAIVAVDIEGRDGVTLKDKWAHGPQTYLGLMSAGFPNLFFITGPGSPSVLSNMAVSIEQHVDWIVDRLEQLRAGGLTTIEPTPTAEDGWRQHNVDCADITLLPLANSWYMGANVPGKPRVVYPYTGGVGTYRAICNEVVDRGLLGFTLSGPGGEQTNDGLVVELQPDVRFVLEMMAELGLPPLDTLPVDAAREFVEQTNAVRPPGPDVAEIVDGTLPGAAGELRYRLYRPEGIGPHPILVYFHGGGWVLGGFDSDDPLCRDLCVRSGTIVISVDYRHAPEARFPAAADDAFAAVRWVADHAIELGGIPGELAVGGWSAGGNLAAVACQQAGDAGGPVIRGQLLLNPVTDAGFDTASYRENADGYVLTRPLMEWFWNHYADPGDRHDPKASPLRATDLSGLPPAVVVTCQFDPLRDEGIAYAEALAAAGVPVRQIAARGHTHTSLTMVDMVISGAPVRAEIADAVRGLFPVTVGG